MFNSGKLKMRINKQVISDIQAASDTRSQEYVSTTLDSSHGHQFGERKALGVQWDIATDHLVISLEDITSAAAKLEPTRKTIMSLASRFFDTIGLFTPTCIMIQFKIFYDLRSFTI